ncbi:MAG: murein biosynthesis integral membrane protein MurJ, partial [Spirochaetales bacterium]|nr:murein biosynthesis integral membrane protein MurJ [Spirochaetales bacterium]
MSKEPGIKKSAIITFIVMGSTFLSRILGFLRTAVISSIFGASGTADVINLTFAIPNNLRKLMAEGALSAAFIPVLSETIQKDKNDKSKLTQKVFSNLIGFQLIIIVPISIFAILFAKPIINILTEFDNPEQIELSISLFRYFINYLLFISISAVIMGLLNSLNYFFIPAVTPILFSISVLSSILLLHRTIGAYSMVVGVLLGGLAQVLFQAPQLYKLSYKLIPDFSFNNDYFKKIIKQWLPVVATSSIFTINQQIALFFSSGLESGSTSALVYALVFLQLPFGIFSASITTVLFPRMSRHVILKDSNGLRDTLNYGIRLLFSLLIPSSIVFLFFGKIIIATALQRGLFTAENTIMTSNVLQAYSLGLFSIGGFNFLQRFFYSSRKYHIPFFTALFVCIIDIILSLVLKETKMRVSGLALANTIAFTLGFFVLLFLSRKSLIKLNGLLIIKSAVKVVISIIPATLISIYFVRIIGDSWIYGGTLKNFGIIIIIAFFW